MIDLWTDIILWQTIRAHRSFSEQGLQLLLVVMHGEEMRELYTTLLSDLAWV